MKILLVILVIALVPVVCFPQATASNIAGGNWNNPKTWENSQIPDVNSDVVIKGNVIVRGPIKCKYVTIIKEGVLEFGEIKDSTGAEITERLHIIDGTLLIRDNWKVTVNQLDKTDSAIINNFGIIKVGN